MCHSICVFILYRLRNVAAYWYKIVTFLYPVSNFRPRCCTKLHHRNFITTFYRHRTETVEAAKTI